MKVIKSILFASDLFKSPISLLFHSQIKISTGLGIVLSLMIYSFLFVSFLNSDFFLRKNPNISDTLMSNDANIALDNTNFGPIFSLVAEDNINYVDFDPSYLNVEAKITYFYTEKNFRTQKIEIVNFTYDADGRIFPLSFTLANDSFINLNLTEENSWNSNYSFLSIAINICDNETSQTICKPLDEILNFVQGKYFYISFLENFYDLNDFENPTKANTQNMKYIQLNKNICNVVSSSLMEVGLYQDKNFYFETGEEQFYRSYQQDPSQFFSFFTTLEKNDIISKKKFKLAEFQFWPSLNKRKIMRKYQKMSAAFSQIGGLLTLLKIFGFVCCSLTKYIKILQNLSEKMLQNIESLEIDNIAKKSNDDHESIGLEHKSLQIQNFSLSNSIDMFTRNQRDLELKASKEFENNISNLRKSKSKERLKKIEQQISSKHVKKKCNITFFKYLRYIFFKYFKFDKEEDLKKDENYNKILILEKLYSHNFDFLNVIEKMNEVEKLKSYLFDPKQIEIFNFISLKHDLKTENSMNNTEKLHEYFHRILKEGEITETDKKLIDLYFMNNK